MRRVFITGATGFIGKNLVKELSQRANYEFLCMTRPTSSQEDVRFLKAQEAEVVTADLTDADSLKGIAQGADVVVHLAAKVKGSTLGDFEAANIIGTRNIVDECENSEVKRFIHVSTVGVYGPVVEADEMSPLNPRTFYETTKAEAEMLVRESSLDAVTVRPGLIFGPHDRSFEPAFRLASKGFMPIIGRADALVQPLYVADFVRILYDVIEGTLSDDVLVVAGEERITLKEFFSQMHPQQKVRFISLPASLAYAACTFLEPMQRLLQRELPLNRHRCDTFTQSRTYNISLLKKTLEPEFTPLADAVTETRQWYAEQ